MKTYCVAEVKIKEKEINRVYPYLGKWDDVFVVFISTDFGIKVNNRDKHVFVVHTPESNYTPVNDTVTFTVTDFDPSTDGITFLAPTKNTKNKAWFLRTATDQWWSIETEAAPLRISRLHTTDSYWLDINNRVKQYGYDFPTPGSTIKLTFSIVND